MRMLESVMETRVVAQGMGRDLARDTSRSLVTLRTSPVVGGEGIKGIKREQNLIISIDQRTLHCHVNYCI